MTGYLVALFFLLGFIYMLFRPSLKKIEVNLLLVFFAVGFLLIGVRMIFLALDGCFEDLLADILAFIIGLLLAFVANAKGGYFVTRRGK